ncbi:saccharopine dehydrogenase NADP-binding domain-containing protein [Azospirillum picis]|uniref:NAD(P)-dependent dehydrogenase (Short-subunit alcohol dehydrogenase family) n=1 Tax=Azospirillum picis TaxID=488438 RepID=A0ABU0MQJ3_9PROT|nr:saccharopine dehydrogenase NADP-binding domain-containing protein [Azospirillum picis]MBP2302170.1 NAD(P)-dependent dehydrogenase (short-subunit alcohol dehydrogenase family) [Azospirillum picis]MDQ0535749.1 NAD(P)-dependent dehydrogenase (short-subunit alcohol dehydrogenase family) [Azospirillum picis]
MTHPRIVFLAGGSGVVGQQVAELLRRRNPQLDIVIGGRRLEAARAVAMPLGASAVAFDADEPSLPAMPAHSLVVGLTNDSHDQLLEAAWRGGYAYLDITRWTERLKQTLVAVAGRERPPTPMVFASSWMASVAALIARWAAAPLRAVESVELNILYAMADRAGPDSTAYIDRLEMPFWTHEWGKWHRRRPFSDGKLVSFGDAGWHRVYRIDTPDQASLPSLLRAGRVDTRIGFDSRPATAMLHGLVRSGLWAAMARPRFDSWRRSVLYNPGGGDAHRLSLSIAGLNPSGKRVIRRALVKDPAGQTHLTALGALLQIENLLAGGVSPGPHLGEAVLSPSAVMAELHREGVEIALDEDGVEMAQ